MTKELISVIVPVFNLEAYIEKAIQSICSQTYHNLEIIIVDDGSTDDSWDIIKALEKSDSRILAIHKENGGVTSARLTGLSMASGNWIGFVDGDDYIEPDMYEILLSNAIKYQADISHCGYQMVFPSRVDYYYNTGKVIEQTGDTGVSDLLRGEFVEPGLVNKLFKAEVIKNSDIEKKMDTSIKINEDLLMNYYFFSKAKKSIFEDHCFYHYMVREDSAATAAATIGKLRDPIKVCSILLKETKNHPVWQNLVRERYVGLLVNLAVTDTKGVMSWAKPLQSKAHKKLRRILPGIVTGRYHLRTKLLAVWAAAAPGFYCKVHATYAHVRGTDKKYSVE